jgi:hypothetical protein
LCTPSREPVTLSITIVLYHGVFRHHPFSHGHTVVLRSRSGERNLKVSEAGMGGNGPQHTFELRGAIGSETTIARLTQSSAFCCARPLRLRIFFLDCGGSRGRIECRYRYVALRRPVVCVVYPQSSVHALRAHVVRRSVPGAKPPLSSRPVALCGGMLGVRVRRGRDRNLRPGTQADLHVGLACVPPRVNPSHYPLP